MTKYIYICKYSLPDVLCDEIITLYENEGTRYKGVTFSGVNTTIKDTTDFIIPKNNSTWNKIERFLYKELYNNLSKYIQNLRESNYESDKNNQKILQIFDKEILHIDNLMCQKYNKGTGKYIYHNDFLSDYKNKRHRVITYLWYLNDVIEGGETEFFGNFNIQPKKGQLIFFPASWCFPHRGKIPISDNKYIITGWFYQTGY
jgi:Rps23 Pro-64 3,4-dihydroxylase Tpa1-like proline 4-hydroxylase